MDSTTFDPERTVEIGGGKYLFKPLVYRQYRRFLTSIPKLGEDLAESNPEIRFSIDDLADDKKVLGVLMEIGPALMDRLLEWFAKSISKEDGQEVTEEFLADNLELVDFAKMLRLFVEVNELKEVFENFRRIGSAMGMKGLPKPISS